MGRNEISEKLEPTTESYHLSLKWVIYSARCNCLFRLFLPAHYPTCRCLSTSWLLYLFLSYSSLPTSGGISTGSCETCPLQYVFLFMWPVSPSPILPRRLVPLLSGAIKSSSSKTTKAVNGAPGSTNVVELSRSKPPGDTRKSWGNLSWSLARTPL